MKKHPGTITHRRNDIKPGNEYPTIKIGMCQVYTEEWAVEANIRRTLEAIDLVASQGAEIAVTPECVFHGYASDESNGRSEAFRRRLYSIAEEPDGENLKLFRDQDIRYWTGRP